MTDEKMNIFEFLQKTYPKILKEYKDEKFNEHCDKRGREIREEMKKVLKISIDDVFKTFANDERINELYIKLMTMLRDFEYRPRPA